MIEMSVSRHRPTVAMVDLDRLRKNFESLRERAGREAFLCPMVKANAYGHGDIAVAKCLREAGARHLGVGLIEEGLHLRYNDDAGSILHFGLFDRAGAEVMAESVITPVISTEEGLAAWCEVADGLKTSSQFEPLAFHLKINSGMNRLGLAPERVKSVAAKIAKHTSVRLVGVGTHFSDGEDAGVLGGRTEEQLHLFRRALADLQAGGLKSYKVHVANSATLAGLADEMKSLGWGLRPGISLYGIEPESKAGKPLGVEPVLQFLSRVVLIQDVRRGERVSYGGRWTAACDSRIGVIPCGYADGYRRGLTGAPVLVRGIRVPVVGTICMDYFMCDLTEVQAAAVGDLATLIGKQLDSAEQVQEIKATDLAQRLQTISYEIFTGISERVPRLYVDAKPPLSVLSNI